MKTSRPGKSVVLIGGGLALAACALVITGCPPTGDTGPTVTIIDGPFELSEDMSLGGILEADSIDIQAGVTLRATDDLTIRSKGPVMIAGAIEGMTLADRGASITIESEGAITVMGQVLAGDAPVSDVVMTADNAIGNAGMNGGSVSLVSQSDITIDSQCLITSGNGSSAGGAFAVASGTSTGELSASAGAGGQGGDVVIEAGGTLTITPSPTGDPIIILGNGGHGGVADVMDDAAGEAVTGTTARSGPGGRSGMPRWAADALEGLTFNKIDVEFEFLDGVTYRALWEATGDTKTIIGGGIGGNGGDAGGQDGVMKALIAKDARFAKFARFTKGSSKSDKLSAVAFQSGTCPPAGGKKGRDDTDPGSDGEAGYTAGGSGGDATAVGEDGSGSKAGGKATATGGNGGDLWNLLPLDLEKTFLGIPVGLTITAALDGRAGAGGTATAKGGTGGIDGGSGGDATATGGMAGNAFFKPAIFELALFTTTGGAGGLASAVGGSGLNAVRCCNPTPKPGQNGGMGGNATATSRNGGTGRFAGDGGSVTKCNGGRAGDGGDGIPKGFAGTSGAATPKAGIAGAGTFPGNPGKIDETSDGAEGVDGFECVLEPMCDPAECPAAPVESCKEPFCDQFDLCSFRDIVCKACERCDFSTNMCANKPPVVPPIEATFDPDSQSTDYFAGGVDPENCDITISWSTPSCGSVTLGGSANNIRTWFHPHPPCDETQGHAGEVTMLTVSDGKWNVVCTYSGSLSGTGPACAAATLVTPGG